MGINNIGTSKVDRACCTRIKQPVVIIYQGEYVNYINLAELMVYWVGLLQVDAFDEVRKRLGHHVGADIRHAILVQVKPFALITKTECVGEIPKCLQARFCPAMHVC